MRILLNLLTVRSLKYEKLFVGLQDSTTVSVLNALDLTAETWQARIADGLSEYYFPIHHWMNERVRPTGIKVRLKSTLKQILVVILAWGDRLGILGTADGDVFIQSYHPTRDIVAEGKTARLMLFLNISRKPAVVESDKSQ